MGKGSKRRPPSKLNKWDSNYDAIFKKNRPSAEVPVKELAKKE